ncbi:unnamed protein product [Porites lobata]|uniref:Ig-like domain-containing protein n=1 Tax=Porites lobata TaxID=104759 RepID=A0ABN8SH83_9CNID|nr:unnamed protein product [Porites lobata]
MSTARRSFALIVVVIAFEGARAEDMKVCPKEMVKLYCPPLEQAIKSGDYRELIWKVADPRDKSDSARKLGYCGENLSCTSYNSLENFDERITIRNSPVNGTLYIEQEIKDDLLTFTCSVQRKQNKDPLVHQVNVFSSVNCLTLTANQAFNLSGALGKMVSTAGIQDMWWYWVKRDGKMQKIAYCNSESCVFDECNSTCQSRFRIDGATLELTEVREEDRGLQLQCEILPKFQTLLAAQVVLLARMKRYLLTTLRRLPKHQEREKLGPMVPKIRQAAGPY